MKINLVNNSPNFNGIYNNKIVLKSLENISDHSASFQATSAFLSALFLRPLAINLLPKVDEKNKQVLSIDSIVSAMLKFLLAEVIILPIEKAIKNIDRNPEKFLKNKTIENLGINIKNASNSIDYKFSTQLVKQMTNFLTTIPKTILGVSILPIIMDFVFNKKKDNNENSLLNQQIKKEKEQNYVMFSGGYEKAVSKIVNSDFMQEISKKHSKNGKNLVRNLNILNDTLLSTGSIVLVHNSNKIDEKQKKVLNFNKLLSTLMSFLFSFSIDEFIQKTGKKITSNFMKANANSPKLAKYIDGLNVFRPTIVFATVYYFLMPIITTKLSDEYSKNKYI